MRWRSRWVMSFGSRSCSLATSSGVFATAAAGVESAMIAMVVLSSGSLLRGGVGQFWLCASDLELALLM